MKELIEIQAELKAPKGQFNAFGKYKYRSCEDILEAVKPLLKKHKCFLVLNDEMIEVGGRIYVKATASISSEEGTLMEATALAREPEAKKGMDESQITGAASSYARKYALNGLFAIDDAKDADTQDNSNHKRQAPKTEIDKAKDWINKGGKVEAAIAALNKKGFDLSTEQVKELENGRG